ncbi:Bug family tripartite tricarboxylate transporter substrate binding protein [Neoroseomonas oryzicola]|uniref:Tripartite tricarboxylate transporter substrate binding protein n=1 Tax=Neoroseomonas oryzicola TaxID=535904 RepID=A0A9X9WF08_9PROT|nr:tripartite tricarboxylate transporter substrate binding protein [Neoroseomonas oryzicola]MBR0658918.1 tripartite tricarboxylate transporter substrate binding protein [Neoroseomonas oryzicola]NKE15730.1 tripartite tricarboxylate transporter substrate binding protein [Neoroseomonas oryzicola]
MTTPPALRRRHLIGGAAGLIAAPGPAGAQPVAGGRPLRVIVPFPPGGAVDITSRLFAEKLGPVLGQTVVVENRGGAGGLIGADALAKGEKDGGVIALISATTWCAAQFMHARMPFDPQRDLTPITQLTDGALLCVVNAQTAQQRGWTDFRALIRWSQANPEQVRMGSSGSGTSSHLNISAINRFADAKILHVPYRGGGPAINDLLAGNIDMMFDVMPALMPHVEGGKFKALAVSSADPLPMLPNIPGMKSFADLGLGDHALVNWNVVTTAGGTPAPVVQRLFEAVQTVARQREFVERLSPLGYGIVLSDSPAAAGAMIRAETPRWQRLVEISGARME